MRRIRYVLYGSSHLFKKKIIYIGIIINCFFPKMNKRLKIWMFIRYLGDSNEQIVIKDVVFVIFTKNNYLNS
jgi:hypothetical protein